MKSEHRTLAGKLQEEKKNYADLQEAEIPEAKVVALFIETRIAISPPYRNSGIKSAAGERRRRSEAKPRSGPDPGGTGRGERTTQNLEEHSRDMVRGAKRIELKTKINHLESQVDIAAGQIAAFEKEVEKKASKPTPWAGFDHRTNGKGRGRNRRTVPAAWPKNRNASALNSGPSHASR